MAAERAFSTFCSVSRFRVGDSNKLGKQLRDWSNISSYDGISSPYLDVRDLCWDLSAGLAVCLEDLSGNNRSSTGRRPRPIERLVWSSGKLEESKDSRPLRSF